MLEDIAILTGGTVINEDNGLLYEDKQTKNIVLNITGEVHPYLGFAEKITVSKDNTTVINGKGEKEKIAARVGQIKKQIETTTSDYDRENCRNVWQNWPAVLQYSM